jgi:hypothetical protein
MQHAACETLQVYCTALCCQCTASWPYTWLLPATPSAGLLLQSSSNAPLVLAAMQWLFFLAPTAYHTQKQGWGLARVFKLQPCTPLQALQGALGAALPASAMPASCCSTGSSALHACGLWQPDGTASAAQGGALVLHACSSVRLSICLSCLSCL